MEVGEMDEEDSQAFVVVTPAQEVLGRGFLPLQEESGPRSVIADGEAHGSKVA